MLRRFRTWLADIIRPVDVHPAPVVVTPDPTRMKIKSNHVINRADTSDFISTKVFSMIIGYPCQTIIAWKNGPAMYAGKSIPRHFESGQKQAVMWDRSECFDFADHLKKYGKLIPNAQFEEICMSQLGEMLGVTRGAAWHIAKNFHKKNPNTSYWRVNKSGKRVISREQAIQIGLERAGLAV